MNKTHRVRLQNPCPISLVGPTRSGKTTYVLEMIRTRHDLFEYEIEKVVYCYGINQPIFEEFRQAHPDVLFHEGVPEDILGLFDGKTQGLLILDDLLDAISKDVEVMKAIIQGSHHRNITIITLSQNVFHQGKTARTNSINTHYFVLFNNARDRLQIAKLFSQAFPHEVKRVQEAYLHAIRHSHEKVLVLDFSPFSNDDIRLRADILPSTPYYQRVYYPKVRIE